MDQSIIGSSLSHCSRVTCLWFQVPSQVKSHFANHLNQVEFFYSSSSGVIDSSLPNINYCCIFCSKFNPNPISLFAGQSTCIWRHLKFVFKISVQCFCQKFIIPWFDLPKIMLFPILVRLWLYSSNLWHHICSAANFCLLYLFCNLNQWSLTCGSRP